MAAIAREIIFDLLFEEILGTSKENRNEVEMKFTFEREWIKVVKRARYRPNYGMGNTNSGLEKLSGNKLELPGPMVDSYPIEGNITYQPRSFVFPWQVFRHMTILL